MVLMSRCGSHMQATAGACRRHMEAVFLTWPSRLGQIKCANLNGFAPYLRQLPLSFPQPNAPFLQNDYRLEYYIPTRVKDCCLRNCREIIYTAIKKAQREP